MRERVEGLRGKEMERGEIKSMRKEKEEDERNRTGWGERKEREEERERELSLANMNPLISTLPLLGKEHFYFLCHL